VGFNSAFKGLIWVVYSGEVGDEVDTRYRICHGGWEVWVHGGTLLLYVYRDIHIIAESPHVPTPPNLCDTYVISCPPHLLPHHCIQPILSLV